MSPAANLLKWYEKNSRPLPWRETSDPYQIWISEIMLQQTTVKAVIPFYTKFMKKFPKVSILAKADLEDVYQYWAGLGYYSRARNLHKAAKIINQSGFPTSHLQLAELPGFGPYISRAVGSFAFKENVGVLDGNVIRFLCRLYDLDLQWWQTTSRRELQKRVDAFVEGQKPDDINQALIEIGATICTSKNPACLICPMAKNCLARKKGTISLRPLTKPRKPKQTLVWSAEIYEKKGRIKLVENNYAPFLKTLPILPGRIRRSSKQPTKYDFCHSIMHYKIYVRVSMPAGEGPQGRWLSKGQIERDAPSSLIKKALLNGKS